MYTNIVTFSQNYCINIYYVSIIIIFFSVVLSIKFFIQFNFFCCNPKIYINILCTKENIYIQAVYITSVLIIYFFPLINSDPSCHIK